MDCLARAVSVSDISLMTPLELEGLLGNCGQGLTRSLGQNYRTPTEGIFLKTDINVNGAFRNTSITSHRDRRCYHLAKEKDKVFDHLCKWFLGNHILGDLSKLLTISLSYLIIFFLNMTG